MMINNSGSYIYFLWMLGVNFLYVMWVFSSPNTTIMLVCCGSMLFLNNQTSDNNFTNERVSTTVSHNEINSTSVVLSAAVVCFLDFQTIVLLSNLNMYSLVEFLSIFFLFLHF